MAKKNRQTMSRTATRSAKTGVFVSKREGGGRERWFIRSDDGRIVNEVTTNPESAASMDRAVKRYSRALKRLAKR